MEIDRKKCFKALVVVLMAAILMGWWVFMEGRKNEFLEIDFFDIGQGDAIFIETSTGKQILIDGGPGSLILEKLGKEMHFWDRYIDLIVLSHPEYDHMSGLIEVIQRYKIGHILTTELTRETAEYQKWRELIEKEKIPVLIARAGMVIGIDDKTELDVLYPYKSLKGKTAKQANNYSVVVMINYQEFRLLLTGDIEKKVEKILVDSRADLKASILKVAHHGSKTSTTQAFLEAVSPVVAIIQAGKDNSYGHPHLSVLERLKNIPVFSTIEYGDIKILTNGLNFWIK